MLLMLWMLRRDDRDYGDVERVGGGEVAGEGLAERQWKGP